MKLREALDQVRDWLRASSRRQISAVGIGLGVIALAVSLPVYLIAFSGSDDRAEDVQSIPTPSATVARSSPTPNPTPTATPEPALTATPEPLSSLGKALVGGEMLALRAIDAPNLMYAVKKGKHVTVFLRNIETGERETLLEYDERVEAQHSGNLWQELPPSVVLSPAEPVLVYSDERDILTFDIDDRTSTTVLRRGEGMGSGDLIRYAWVSGSGSELCCAFGLASPVVSRDGTSVVLSMTQYEGHKLGVFRLDGSTACVVSQQGVTTATSLFPAWSAQTGDLLIPSGGVYAAPGLFVAPADDPCSSQDLVEGAHEETARFEAADWSPDGDWIAASMLPKFFDPSSASLLLMRRDGSERRTLVEEGINLWPLFSPNGDSVYFIQRSDWYDEPAVESLWQFDLENEGMNKVVDIPPNWSAQPSGWTSDGYLILNANRNETGLCGYLRSCDNRVLLLDPATGAVVYSSAATDFTSYLGFLP